MSTDLVWLPGDPSCYPKPAACRFVTAEAFLSIALKAYLAATDQLVPPRKEKWIDEGVTWANAESFYQQLTHEMDTRLCLAALESGDLFDRAMAHGCAASSPAVGPAQEADQGRADLPNADPLFLDHERQELPAVAAACTQNTAIGAA